jgi:uridylate kinase
MTENKRVLPFNEEKKFVASLGGSVLFGELKSCETNSLVEFDEVFVGAMIEFLRSLSEEEYSTAIVVGGGGVARARQEDIEKLAGDSDELRVQLDHIGIGVSETNAASLLTVLLTNGIPAARLKRDQEDFESSKVYVRGGTEPGHTTDFVAVQAAVGMGASIVVNISNTPGLHPFLEDGSLDKSQIIDKLSLSEYIEKFAVEHDSGVNTPFDVKGARLAMEHGIIVVLVGNDPENIKRLQAGEDFIGTVLN